MDYNHIKNYLDKIRNVLLSKEEAYDLISSSIYNNISVKIEKKFIQIKGNIIYIKASPLVRNEILINKDKILKDLSSLSINTKYIDIR